jgi:glutathione S-transferase
MTNYVTILILVALLQYAYFTGRVGLMRGKFNVPAPKCIGNDTWERMFRVQQNTMEQLVIFIPGMIFFSTYVSTTWAVVLGCAFVAGRAIYSYRYISDPASRSPGAGMSMLSNMILVIGSLVGLAMKMAS